jgi:hypothetical protein
LLIGNPANTVELHQSSAMLTDHSATVKVQVMSLMVTANEHRCTRMITRMVTLYIL